MNSILVIVEFTLVLCLLCGAGTTAQKHGKGTKTGVTTPTPFTDRSTLSIPFLVQPGSTSQSDLDRLVQQNASLPFSVRFPKPERKSDKFHYPVLPSVYWTLHKQPEVPLVEPEQELGYGVSIY